MDTKWVTQQWIARGLSSAVVDPIATALAGRLPAASSSSAAAVAPVGQQQQQRPRAADVEGPSAAEVLLAGKRGKGKGKKGASKSPGKGFGA